MARPPGPRAPLAVQTAAFAARPLPFLEACRRRYGDVFSLRVAPFGKLTYFADPAACKELFTGDTDVFRAGEANQFLGPSLGASSLLLLDGDEHLQTRKLMLPPFHGEAVKRYAEIIEQIAAHELQTWPAGQPFAVRPAMQRITLDVILRAVFGIDDPERLERLRGLLSELMAQNPAFLWFEWMRVDLGPRSPYGRFLRLRDRVDAILFDEIARRRRDPSAEERVDVLSLLLRARYPDGSRMPDGALRDQLMTLLLAGHETTATGLAWACERLVRHPEVMERAREDDAYLDATVKEVLRSRPVVIDVARVVAAPATVAGFDLEPGTMAIPAIAVVQRGENAWPDPDAFRPERLPQRLAAGVRVDPVRRRRAPLHRRRLRAAGDEGGAAHGARAHAARRAARARRRGPADAPRHARALAGRRDRGRGGAGPALSSSAACAGCRACG